MKTNTIKTLAVALLLVLTVAGCKKENVQQTPASNENLVYYVADGQWEQTILLDDNAWYTFLHRMLALAKDGNVVTISHSRGYMTSPKETVTYTTKNENSARQWVREMYEQGYDVSISFDPQTGVFTGTAIKNVPYAAAMEYIAVDEWLPETQWTVQRIYNGFFDEEYTWIQFRAVYNDNKLGDMINDNCRDTISFGNGSYIIYGDQATGIGGNYSVTDSVVSLGATKLYQINADSMIVYNWHDCSFTEDIQQWLFTRIM